MLWAKIVLLCIYAASLAVNAAKNGQPTKYRFDMKLLAFCVIIALLWASGFFNF